MIVHMIGNAHIDPVWLWRWQAGVDESLATFRSAVDRCDEYPEFIFTRGEAWTYAQVERLDPALFERVRELIAAGRWEIAGGQWIQPDVNLPTAEGLRRQVLRGGDYFRSRFGHTPTYGYNVDSFGHPASLPDLLNEVGQTAYVCARGTSTSGQPLPPLFRWRGVGGGELLTFKMHAGYVTRSEDLYGQIMMSVEAAGEGAAHTMAFYGVGNHGGGPTKENIESVLAMREFLRPRGIDIRFSSPARFLPRLRRSVLGCRW